MLFQMHACTGEHVQLHVCVHRQRKFWLLINASLSMLLGCMSHVMYYVSVLHSWLQSRLAERWQSFMVHVLQPRFCCKIVFAELHIKRLNTNVRPDPVDDISSWLPTLSVRRYSSGMGFTVLEVSLLLLFFDKMVQLNVAGARSSRVCKSRV